MKFSFKTLLVAVATTLAFATTSCTEKQQDNVEGSAENAAATTENAVDNAGNAVEGAANEVKADMAPEKGDTAVVVEQPANKVVEEVPATQK